MILKEDPRKIPYWREDEDGRGLLEIRILTMAAERQPAADRDPDRRIGRTLQRERTAARSVQNALAQGLGQVAVLKTVVTGQEDRAAGEGDGILQPVQLDRQLEIELNMVARLPDDIVRNKPAAAQMAGFDDVIEKE